MIKFVLKKNANKNSATFNKWYAFPVIEQDHKPAPAGKAHGAAQRRILRGAVSGCDDRHGGVHQGDDSRRQERED